MARKQKAKLIGIHDPNWQYTRTLDTDIAKTWAKHGYIPPSKMRQSKKPHWLDEVNRFEARFNEQMGRSGVVWAGD